MNAPVTYVHLKVLFAFLDLHHNVVDVEEFSSDADVFEWSNGQEPGETMVKLYERRLGLWALLGDKARLDLWTRFPGSGIAEATAPNPPVLPP